MGGADDGTVLVSEEESIPATRELENNVLVQDLDYSISDSDDDVLADNSDVQEDLLGHGASISNQVEADSVLCDLQTLWELVGIEKRDDENYKTLSSNLKFNFGTNGKIQKQAREVFTEGEGEQIGDRVENVHDAS